ncbi:TolC family protein [Lutibacter sp. TH_r2]|uniref:TolC family protein n=1 Tax=Lutibacter sp. TH_r2 TaxID=3082083 RepID=UPI002953E430|nr:TolC family protein [Lutibacter sp. TH_r2]MDV7188371.1 TolC family protein [Lutibacter sp. TH_r2]
MLNYKYTLIAILFSVTISFAQDSEILTKNKAVRIALENNYGIKMANNAVVIAKNNASIYNSGYLPTVSASAGASYSNSTSDLTAQDGTETKLDNAETKAYNASIGLNYTLFDGFGRKYNYQKLKETHNLSELEAKTVIENSLLQLFTIYYEVARLTENNKNLSQSLSVSKNRLKRSQYAYEYGQSTKLDVLNAEVDVNNDSINYINSQRLLANSKRDLNVLLGRNAQEIFEVDTNVNFELTFDNKTLQNKAKQHNIEILKANKNIELSDFDIKINKSGFLPSLSVSTSYALNQYDNAATSLFAEQYSKGINAGLTLSWNIFDGGSTKTNVANAKIYTENIKIEKEQIENQLERDVANALEIYNNSLFILSSEKKNVETNQRNFDRSEERFKLGQITSIEFRQAQINLLNSKSSLNTAKYNAKNAELSLLQLTGELLNNTF